MTICSTCHGKGFIQVDWGEAPCPGCRLQARADRIREAADDSVERLYKEQYGPDYKKLATYQAEGR